MSSAEKITPEEQMYLLHVRDAFIRTKDRWEAYGQFLAGKYGLTFNDHIQPENGMIFRAKTPEESPGVSEPSVKKRKHQ